MSTRRLPHLTWLRAFEASARHLSFTHAAQELNLTQAAISKQVKLLEHYLREPLFERKPRSLVLTKVGAAYLPKVRDGFERLAAGTEEVFGLRRSEVLTVRAPVGYSVNWIAPRLQGFFDRHPESEVRLVSSVWGDQFDNERFDLDIQYGTGRWPGYTAERLTWEVIKPVCAPALLDGERALRQPEDLVHHRLLHVLGYEEGWADWLRYAQTTGVNSGQGLQFDTSLLAFEFAARGGGVALARSSMLGVEIERGRLVTPFEIEAPLQEAFYLISPETGRDHPDARKFSDWLVETAANDPENRRIRTTYRT
ncbi:transcriptional regulator GcvA [Ruegeria pomeroyi]|nr:transcriptional regulator GcvA [Ruegeria pomeroyi]MCE8522675.1 transcriptional regulator GcvA [Ruegeria pomeroyi]MCE8527027.1 transcriptional regulator GcvA [Ruegeria pomeroyi]MCE8530436.1 transcriptional regulator GcvA [Ruegeria pomeroyi]MCE8533255.1 transcriptional regulator GcvA [Ruegeria pomeroyi]